MSAPLVLLAIGLFLGSCIALGTQPEREILTKIIAECGAKSGTTDAEMRRVLYGRIPKTKNEACFLGCVQKQYGTRGADNKVVLERAKALAHPLLRYNAYLYNQTIHLIEECTAKEESGQDECTAARKYSECAHVKLKEMRPPVIPVENYTECITKSGVNATELINALVHNVPKSKKEACMVGCLEKQFGVLGVDNKINITQVSRRFMFLREDSFKQIIKVYKDCETVGTADANECVAAQKYAECVYPKERPLLRKRHDDK